MARNSTIEWTQVTWNPVVGCEPPRLDADADFLNFALAFVEQSVIL